MMGIIAEFCFSQAGYSQVLFTVDVPEGFEGVLAEPLIDELV